MENVRHFFPILTNSNIFDRFFYVSNIKFHGNPSIGSIVDIHGQRERRMDIRKVIGDYANTTKMEPNMLSPALVSRIFNRNLQHYMHNQRAYKSIKIPSSCRWIFVYDLVAGEFITHSLHMNCFTTHNNWIRNIQQIPCRQIFVLHYVYKLTRYTKFLWLDFILY